MGVILSSMSSCHFVGSLADHASREVSHHPCIVATLRPINLLFLGSRRLVPIANEWARPCLGCMNLLLSQSFLMAFHIAGRTADTHETLPTIPTAQVPHAALHRMRKHRVPQRHSVAHGAPDRWIHLRVTAANLLSKPG